MREESRFSSLTSGFISALFLCAALVAPATAQQTQGTLIQSIDASQFTPPSPDTAGATYLDFSDSILVSDSEVNESNLSHLFTGDNLFEVNQFGSNCELFPNNCLLGTLTTIPFSNEPTGSYL